MKNTVIGVANAILAFVVLIGFALVPFGIVSGKIVLAVSMLWWGITWFGNMKTATPVLAATGMKRHTLAVTVFHVALAAAYFADVISGWTYIGMALAVGAAFVALLIHRFKRLQSGEMVTAILGL